MRERILAINCTCALATLLLTFSIIGCSKKGINNSKSGYGIGEKERKVIYRDRSMLKGANPQQSGEIVMKICIDRKGDVVYVELDENESSIDDKEVLKNALRSMYKYKYEADATAPKEECGKFTVSIDNWKGTN